MRFYFAAILISAFYARSAWCNMTARIVESDNETQRVRIECENRFLLQQQASHALDHIPGLSPLPPTPPPPQLFIPKPDKPDKEPNRLRFDTAQR
jgi:hypothetical protein